MPERADYTTGDISRRCGVPSHIVRRLLDEGAIVTARRVGLYRVVSASDLPAIEKALRDRGAVKAETVACD